MMPGGSPVVAGRAVCRLSGPFDVAPYGRGAGPADGADRDQVLPRGTDAVRPRDPGRAATRVR